ncbi:MAG: hypothetical protein HY901_30200, partial [Deltaproteobacteria bacterium]|nr:hypothetical protein [Deltaproteobacteria bacterium]
AARLEVLPGSLKFTSAGETAILITHLSDRNDQSVQHSPCVFVTGDALIAEVRQDGTVTANGAGATEIRVQCERLTASVPVRVSLPSKVVIEARCEVRCSQMAADPLSLKLEGAGSVAKLTARVSDVAGDPVPVEVRWEVADPDFRAGTRARGVDISKDGELRANGAVGKYLVLASAGSVMTRGNVEVSNPVVDVLKAQGRLWIKPGAEAQIEPKGFRRTLDGLKPIAGARFGYTSSNPSVVKVGDDGRILGMSEGSTDVVVAADSGAFAQVQVTVAEKDPWAAPPAPEKPPKAPRRKR